MLVPTAEDLVAAPRGRRLCMSAAVHHARDLWTFWLHAAWATEPISSASSDGSRGFLSFGPAGLPIRPPHFDRAVVLPELVTALDRVDLTPLSTVSEAAAAQWLADTVDAARYWQEPDDQDVVLAEPTLRPGLLRVAAALLPSPVTSWWSSGCDLTAQRWSDRWDSDRTTEAPPLAGSAAGLQSWSRELRNAEARALEHGAEPTADQSGDWWSVPAWHLLRTTRALPELGAVDLACVEDNFGEREADVWPLEPVGIPRVLEIDGPDAWADLVRRHPVPIRSRTPDWYRATGCTGPWAIPDWPAVAEEWDAVHVTVFGYLTTATRPIRVDHAFTLLAGAAPDATIWLTDALRIRASPTHWSYEVRIDDGDRWLPSV